MNYWQALLDLTKQPFFGPTLNLINVLLIFLTVVVMYLSWRDAKKASELQILPLLSIYFKGKFAVDRKIRIRNIGESPAYSIEMDSFTLIVKDIKRFWKLDFSLRGTNVLIPGEERDLSLMATANGVKTDMEDFLLFALDPDEDHDRKRMGLVLTYKNSEGVTYYSEVETGKGGLFIKGARRLDFFGNLYLFKRFFMEKLMIFYYEAKWKFPSIFQRVVRSRSEMVVKRVLPYLTNSNAIVDIGSGTGDITFLLQQSGKKVAPVDVGDFHGPRLVETTIYDGKTLPFADKTFDTALLLMVLHHTPDPETVFSEAARVAKEIVMIETSYKSSIERFFTIFFDTIGNLRLKGFWSSYKSDKEWRAFFKKAGFEIQESHSFNDKKFGVIPFLHILYYLKHE